MSELSIIAEQLSLLKEGELAVLKKIIEAIQTNAEAVNSIAETALGWSKYSIKTQKNPSLSGIIDPFTGESIVEPDIQTIESYPIMFGPTNISDVQDRSITFAFGSKAFLCYENNATGVNYVDTKTGSSSNKGETEVVNYRTLKTTLATFSTSYVDAQIAALRVDLETLTDRVAALE